MNPAIVAAIFRGARAYALYSAGSRSARGRQDEPSEAQQMRESQRRFRDRLARGEVISDEELANAPVGHVPEELSERRWNARFNQSIQAAGGSSGGSGGRGGATAGGAGGGYVPPTAGQPGGGASGGSDQTGPTVGDFIRVILKATATVTGLVKGLELFNRGMISVHQNLSQFDGRLAQAYASLEVADIRRGQERSQQIGGSLAGLIAAQNELRDTTYGIGTEVQGILIDMAGHATRIVNYVNKITYAGESIITILQAIRSILGTDSESKELPAWSNFFHDVSNGTFEGKVQQFPVNAGWGGANSARESAMRGRPGP